MRIHLGCDLRFELPQTTPMIATLIRFDWCAEGLACEIAVPATES
jgi:hypothetical protein